MPNVGPTEPVPTSSATPGTPTTRHRGGGVRVVPQVHRREHALGVARGVGEAPQGGALGVQHEAAGADLALWDAYEAARDVARSLAGDEPAGHVHHANARLAGGGVRVRDGGDGAHLVVRRAGEGEREDAHEGPVAVVALARATAPGGERVGGGAADVEEAAHGVRALAVPTDEALPHVANVDAARGTDAVAARERHGGVVTPSAGGLVVRAVPRHARALERAAGAELVRHAEGVAHGLSVDAVAKGGGVLLRDGHGAPFEGRTSQWRGVRGYRCWCVDTLIV